jgi:hypothetical protein
MGDFGRGCCLLFDSTLGGSGPSTTETTQTTSGTSRGVAGNKNQYTESGSISVAQKGKYIESGALDLSGQKISVQKGASLTLNQAPQGSQPQSAAPAPAPVLAPVDVPSTPDTSSTITAPASPSTDTSGTSQTFLATLQGYWANFSVWQKIGAGTVIVLVLWLVFHKRR